VGFSEGELATQMPAVSAFFRGVKGWPSADLAKLLGLVHAELHARAEHHREGGGIEEAIAKRPRKKLPRDKGENA
jgi:hypothetical protein